MPLTWISLSFLLGFVISIPISLPWTVWLGAAGGCGLLLYLLRRAGARWPWNQPLARVAQLLTRRHPVLQVAPAVLIFCTLLGSARLEAQRAAIQASALPVSSSQPVSLSAWVDSPPETVSNGLRADCRVETLAGQPHGGRVRVTFPAGTVLHYGDELILTGRLSLPYESEDFSYRDYLFRQGITAIMSAPAFSVQPAKRGNFLSATLFRIRERGNTVLAQIFSYPESSLLQGILLGDDSRLPDQTMQDFRDTGTSHIIAISGFNVAILSGLIASLFTRLLGRKKGSLVTVIGISLYTVLVGASASVVRACIMGGLSLLAAGIGRRQNGVNTLAFTAAVMGLQDPYVLQDAGFQLSFAATLGLVLYALPLQEVCEKALSRLISARRASQAAGWIAEYFLFTLAAHVTTLPILILTFQRFSPVTFLANPLILPAQPPLMILGGLALLAGLVSLPLGQIMGLFAWPFAAYTLRVIEGVGPLARSVLFTSPVEPVWVILFYLLLLILTFPGLRQAVRPHLKPGLALLAAATAAVCVWQMVFDLPDGNLHLWVFGSEQSAERALLLRTPGGKTLLVGSLTSPQALKSFLGRQLPWGTRQIDAVILPPASAGQTSSLTSVLENDRIPLLIFSPDDPTAASEISLIQAVQDQGGKAIPATPGRELDLGSGIRLTLLSSSDDALSIRIDWNQFSGLILSSPPPPGYQPNFPVSVWIQLKGGCSIPASAPGLAVSVCDLRNEEENLPPNPISSRDSAWVHLSTDGTSLSIEKANP